MLKTLLQYTILASALVCATGCADSGSQDSALPDTSLPPNPHSQNDPYSTAQMTSADHSDWMTRIPDNTPLYDMSIPGAHAPSSNKIHSTLINGTQTLTLPDLLKAGLRVFDVGLVCGANGNIVNGPCNLTNPDGYDGYTDPGVSTALTQAADFLAAHPHETVLLRVRRFVQGSGTNDSVEDWSGHFATYIDSGVYANGTLQVKDKIYISAAGPQDAHPQIGDLRGKIVVLRDYDPSSLHPEVNAYGLDFAFFRANLLESLSYSGVSELYSHWSSVKQQLLRVNAAHQQADTGLGAMTYLTGYKLVYANFVASGFDSYQGHPLTTGLTTTSNANTYPDFNRFTCTLPNGKGTCSIYYTGLNFMIFDSLTHQPSRAGDNNQAMTAYRNLGVVMMDFPGDSLIRAIVNTNRNLNSPI